MGIEAIKRTYTSKVTITITTTTKSEQHEASIGRTSLGVGATNWTYRLSHYNIVNIENIKCIRLHPIRYPSCSGALAPGLAADMHFRDSVIAYIGPACAFALEPVARLAAYWNSPIITGMGDQVSVQLPFVSNEEKAIANDFMGMCAH